jgi:hypothetical protein
MGRVAEVVGIPSEGWGCLGGVVDAICRRERRVMPEDVHGEKKEDDGARKKVKSNDHGSTTALEAINHMFLYSSTVIKNAPQPNYIQRLAIAF